MASATYATHEPLACDTNTREVIDVIERSFRAADPADFLLTLQAGLVWLSRAGVLESLPYPEQSEEHYTRRAFHIDPGHRFSILGMTWAPGQETPLHDHAGRWCVEVVVEGEMQVINFRLLHEDAHGRCRFTRCETIGATRHSSGGLIPPFEHHIFRNAGTRAAHTLHIYGGLMETCAIFEPAAGGFWQRKQKDLRCD